MISKLVFPRILCETVKDFVAKVGKAYDKSTENAEECNTMSLKVSLKTMQCSASKCAGRELPIYSVFFELLSVQPLFVTSSL